MPATILPFERRDTSSSVAVRSDEPESDSRSRPALLPASRLTSRNIAHRWAMLSHLTRHYPRRAPDPIR